MQAVQHNKIEIRMIAAITDDGSIGKDGDLMIYDQRDLDHFKRLTEGSPIIMGRKTFESLPRVLPGRPHFVLTSDPDQVTYPNNPKEVPVVLGNNLEELVVRARRSAIDTDSYKISFIGGESIYKAGLAYADCCYLTSFPSSLVGDAKFPISDMIWEMPDTDYVDSWEDQEGHQITLLKYSRPKL